MQKYGNKKCLLFFSFTALMLVNSAKPMCEVLLLYTTNKLIHCFKKCTQQNHEDLPANTNTSKKPLPIRPNPAIASTKTTIKDLPDDCLYEIFRFTGCCNDKEILNLRFVSKKFGHAIKMEQNLFKQNLNKYKKFCSDNQNKKQFTITLNKKYGAEFFINRHQFLSLDNKYLYIILRLDTNTQDSFGFLVPWLQTLYVHLKIKENKLKSLAIHHYDPEQAQDITNNPRTKIYWAKAYLSQFAKTDQPVVAMFIAKKTTVYNEEFELFHAIFGSLFHDIFGSISKLIIERCQHFKPPINWPENLEALEIIECPDFKIEYLQGLPEVWSLTLISNDGICKDDALKNVESCKNFDHASLHELPNLLCHTIEDPKCAIM